MRSSLFAYSFSHFCVDFACFWLLFARVMAAGLPLESVSLMFLAYNIIAFGLQAPLGHLCDICPRIPAGLIGCAVVAAGLLASSMLWPGLLLVALGNAFFHVGGGIDSLSGNRMWRSGVFVSTSAPGVALGTLAGKSGLSVALPLGILLVSGVLIAALAPRRKAPPARYALDVSSRAPFAALILLASLSIVIRAYVGRGAAAAMEKRVRADGPAASRLRLRGQSDGRHTGRQAGRKKRRRHLAARFSALPRSGQRPCQPSP